MRFECLCVRETGRQRERERGCGEERNQKQRSKTYESTGAEMMKKMDSLCVFCEL